jgi:meiotically up-regulated gene 157 (Mug157) protein
MEPTTETLINVSHDNAPIVNAGDIVKVMIPTDTRRLIPYLALVKKIRATNSAQIVYLKSKDTRGVTYVLSDEPVDYCALSDIFFVTEKPNLTRRGIY